MIAGMVVAFTGGRVLTMDGARAEPEVVVVDRDRVAAVGERALLDRYPHAEVHDLAGRTLVPGFIDAHNHLSIAALHPRWHDVSGIASVDELVDAVREQAAAEPDAPWVRLQGWNEWTTGVSPTRADLDRAGVDRPVIVVHYTLHQCAVSSAGLDALGVGRATPDPEGGEILRGLDGEPTGVLLERAWSEAHARSLAGYADPDRWAEHLAARARVLLAEGITAVHDAACAPAAESCYRAMAAAGTLPVSVLAMPHPAAILVNDQGGRLDGPVTGEGDEWFRVGPAKFFADGGQAIALDVSVAGERVEHGIVMEDVGAQVARAVERGWRVAVHAMGNVGVQRALEAFAAAAGRRDTDHRFRVEHAAVCSRAQVSELRALGAVAVVQPVFVEHIGEITAGVSLDEHAWLPFGDLAEAGVPLAASSDDPCAPFPPLWGSARGATRRSTHGVSIDPDQAVPFVDWLRAYTVGAAYAGGQESERGSITPGKRADLVVLDGALDAERPPSVAQTWVAGRCVHEARAPGGSPPRHG